MVLAGWVMQDYLKLTTGPRRIFMSVTILMAVLLMIGFPSDDQVSKNRINRLSRPAWFVTMVVAFVVAVGSGFYGYRSDRKGEIPSPPSELSLRAPVAASIQKTYPERVGGSPRASSSPVDEFMRKYVDGDGTATGKRRWTVITSADADATLPDVKSALGEELRRAGLQPVTIFRPQLVSDGKLEALYDPEPALLRSLSSLCDGIVVAVGNSRELPDVQIQGLHTVEFSVQVHVIAISNGFRKDIPAVERGAGYSLEEAKAVARKHVEQVLGAQVHEVLLEALSYRP
jgi:hypothetical protein